VRRRGAVVCAIIAGVALIGTDLPPGPATTEVAHASATDISPSVVPAVIDRAAGVLRQARRLRKPGTLVFPMAATPRCYVLNNFNASRSNGTRLHEGIDLLATNGQPIYAVTDGVLIRQSGPEAALSGMSWGLAGDNGSYYFYAHLSAFTDGLSVGSRVRLGDVIGAVGDTGNAGPGNNHLHFEVHPAGVNTAAVDPFPLLEIPAGCTVY
jgi:murein DD-endopeptidase MepM/ murein hydrolase activator NlpD